MPPSEGTPPRFSGPQAVLNSKGLRFGRAHFGAQTSPPWVDEQGRLHFRVLLLYPESMQVDTVSGPPCSPGSHANMLHGKTIRFSVSFSLPLSVTLRIVPSAYGAGRAKRR